MTRLFLGSSLLAAVLVVSSAAGSRAAWPMYVSETGYTPSSSILAVPTAYVVPTSYTYSGYETVRYRPTSYYLTESSYVLPRRYYRPTTYYLPRTYDSPRSYVTSSLVDYAVTPTSYYLPTTFGMPVMTTSASNLCCDVQPACDSSAPAASAPVHSSANNAANTFNPDSDSAGETPSLNEPDKVLRSSPRAAAPVAPRDSSVGTPPASTPPASTPPASMPVEAAEPAAPADTNPPQPTAPAPEDLLSEPPTVDNPHEVKRPIYPPSTARSTLHGKIVSGTDGKPEKGVTITLAYFTPGHFKDRTKVTGDDGTFSIDLPEGDWTVMVPSADGKIVLERPITVSGGLITDDKDTAVSMLTLNR